MALSNKKILFFNYESLNSSNGVSTFIRRLMHRLPNSKGISFINKRNYQPIKSEVNIRSKSFLGELIMGKSGFTRINMEIFNSELVHINMDNFYSILIALICRWHKKPTVFSIHSNLINSGGIKGLLNRIRTTIVHNFLVLINELSFWSTRSQLNIFKKFTLLKRRFIKRSVVLPNFIEDSIIRKNSQKRFSEIIFVGRYTKMKGFYDILQLASDCKDISFGIIGGNLENAKDFKNINDYGVIDYNKILSFYDKSSLFILPSYTEVFPMTILEAMARGLVILVSDIPGMREIVKEGRNGYLFPPGDINKMKELILNLKNNPKEVERISKKNLKDIWNFTAEKQIPKYVKVYEDVLKNVKK